MKTNYVIGETYYYEKEKLKLIEIDLNCNHPLRCKGENGNIYTFTLEGGQYSWSKPSLSTSPTEFIAPKSKEEYYIEFSKETRERIINAFGITERTILESRINSAITLLKSEGYTITKQY